MEYKHKLHIPKANATIFYNDGVEKHEVRKCLVESVHTTFQILLDERFNEINFTFEYKNHVSDYLKSEFQKFKSNLIIQDFEYRIGNGFEGKKRINLEDFITYLKSENRETIINNILCQ